MPLHLTHGQKCRRTRALAKLKEGLQMRHALKVNRLAVLQGHWGVAGAFAHVANAFTAEAWFGELLACAHTPFGPVSGPIIVLALEVVENNGE